MTTTPVQARNRKRLPATVNVEWDNGHTASIPAPSLPAWLQYGTNQGMESNGSVRTFTDSGTRVTITLGSKR